MLNKCFFQGRLGMNPEVRYTQAGRPVATFTLAVDRDFVDKQTGQREPDWVTIVAWGSTATFVQQRFTKGQMAVVEGRLQVRDWLDRDGAKQRTVEIVASQIYFCGSRGAPASEGNADEGSLPPAPEPELVPVEDDGQLPF